MQFYARKKTKQISVSEAVCAFHVTYFLVKHSHIPKFHVGVILDTVHSFALWLENILSVNICAE